MLRLFDTKLQENRGSVELENESELYITGKRNVLRNG